MRKKYDSTVARIAGNLLSGQNWYDGNRTRLVIAAVETAREIIAETDRTERVVAPCQHGWHKSDDVGPHRRCVVCGEEWTVEFPQTQESR